MTACVKRSSLPKASSKSRRLACAQQLPDDAEPALQGDRGADVPRVRRGRDRQQVAEGNADAIGLVDLGRRVEGGAAELRRQRRRAVHHSPLALEPLLEHLRRLAVAAVLEHPREQLVGGLLRAELLVALLAGQQQARLELAERGDQDKELRDRLEVEVEIAGLAHVVDVGDHDLAERDLRQRDLLAQQDREQQVEWPLEDVQVEIELGDRGHAAKQKGRAGGLASRPLRRTDADRRDGPRASVSRCDRTGLLRAGAEGLLERRLVGAQLLVALADRRQEVDDRLGHGALEVAVAGALELPLDLLLGRCPSPRRGSRSGSRFPPCRRPASPPSRSR